MRKASHSGGNTATIHINNLRLRTIIGIYAWERAHKQDVVINVWLDYNAKQAVANDDIKHSVDYKGLAKEIIQTVEGSHFFLLETLADKIIGILRRHPHIKRAKVLVDKPFALRFADSVSVELSFNKGRDTRSL